MKKFGIKEVVATGIGTALFIVLTEVQIPLGIIPNTSMQPRAAVLAFLAAVFWTGCRRNHWSAGTCTRRCTVLRWCMVELGIPRCDLWNFSWFIRKEI